MRRHSQEANNVLVNRIDFREGGSLDGALLSQILSRIRNLEIKNSGLVKISEFVNSVETPLNLAIPNILVFTSASESEKKFFNQDVPNETILKFGNTTNLNVDIYPDDEPLSEKIITVVPGEFVKIIKHENNSIITWIKTFGP